MKSQAEIHGVIAELGRCIEAGDFDGAAACFAADAVLKLPGSSMVRGAAAIRSALASAFDAQAPKVDIAVERVEVAQSDDLAYAVGSGITHSVPPVPSKWAAIFRRHQGVWKIAVDIHNDDTVI